MRSPLSMLPVRIPLPRRHRRRRSRGYLGTSPPSLQVKVPPLPPMPARRRPWPRMACSSAGPAPVLLHHPPPPIAGLREEQQQGIGGGAQAAWIEGNSEEGDSCVLQLFAAD
ncbi:hypothetical protein GQ55_4G233700 [Panicum hallii var. hallii]|uniref:Uncharacterized protein n=1 Tax=Panicum hallii var. hallii TaxID=1504633 RepID=A0A2T7DZJ6_9POAL|nr:hypothetical protein GQ55_4G233700 [Panicum hallii var. hallii]